MNFFIYLLIYSQYLKCGTEKAKHHLWFYFILNTSFTYHFKYCIRGSLLR